MNKKSVIKFAKNGLSFVIETTNGGETTEINSKEEGFKAITKLTADKKITPEDFSEMRDQILNAEKLPWSESREISVSIGILDGNPLPEILTGSIMSFMSDITDHPDEPVEIAFLKMCNSCHKHGRIYTKTYYTGRLDSKKEAIDSLEEFKKRGYVSEEEFIKVKSEIEASTLK